MPPDRPGALPAAHLRRTSSPTSCSRTARTPGTQPLTPTTDGADRRAAPAPAAGAPRRRRRRAGAGAGAAPQARRGAQAAAAPAAAAGSRSRRRSGLTVAGEVKNYVPVTDEMLRNPPPATG